MFFKNLSKALIKLNPTQPIKFFPNLRAFTYVMFSPIHTEHNQQIDNQKTDTQIACYDRTSVTDFFDCHEDSNCRN